MSTSAEPSRTGDLSRKLRSRSGAGHPQTIRALHPTRKAEVSLLLSNFQSSNLIDPKDVHFAAFFEYDCNVRSWNWQENLFRFLDIDPRTSRCLDCKRTKRNLGCSVLNLLNFHFWLSNSILMLLKF